VTAGHGQQYEPTLVSGTYKLTQEQRLALLFIAYVLGQLQYAPPSAGAIVGLDGRVHKVSLDPRRYAELEGIIDTLRTWIQTPSADPPPVVLNKHCPLCPFRADCRAKAEHDDDLSLLERMTPRARQRYHDHGIFSVKQLSYAFRPRRRRKSSPRSPVKHRFELQALALRTGKTYLHEPPALVRQQLEIFLDFEGIPDRDTQYLLGLLVRQQDDVSYHAFWADTDADEARIWQELLTTLAAYPDAPVYHYGQYEARAIRVLLKRYQPAADALLGRLVNLNAYVYGKVYFPVRSNRLKDIGRWLGVSWPTAEVSGFDSLVWRHRWDKSHDDADKQLLLAYNEADCQALRVLADELTRLRDTGAEDPSVDSSTRPKQYATDTGGRLHREFETILRSAHAEYEHTKISLRRDQPATPDDDKRRVGGQPGHPGHYPTPPKPTKVVQVSPGHECPRCGQSLRTTAKLPDKTIVDLVFTANACRKTVTKYVGSTAYCPRCGGQSCVPPTIGALPRYSFGRGLQTWAIYQRLVLRLPYHVITQAIEEQFHVRVNQGTIVAFIRNFARDYAETEERCRQQLLRSPFIHADETKINILGTNYYTWVFTDGRHVLFRLSATRESVVVREVLGEYTGILITDFYGGYDAVPCRQQKCLVHLIRDLNNDLWRRPFDTEVETFVLDVRDLLVPILEAANKYGLKKRNLRKFTKSVDSFYRRVITSRVYRSEPVRTYQKRFQRYRQSLFTFLEYDGIPWNNNMGERALRHLTVQRKISGSFYESLAPAYLLLLGLAQTCRFQDKSLLKFLLSGEKDVDAFKPTKRRRVTAPGTRTRKNADGLERAIPVSTAALKAGSVLVGEESLSMSRRRKYPEQVLERGVRLVFESGRPIAQVARDLGVHAEALRLRVRRAEARGDVLNGAERQRLVELERENGELRRANEILRAASV
jgi:predicted RecB family nuclease